MIMGMTTIVEAAIIRSFLWPPSVIKVYRPSGRVLTSFELVATIGHKNEFQAAMELNRIMIAMVRSLWIPTAMY